MNIILLVINIVLLVIGLLREKKHGNILTKLILLVLVYFIIKNIINLS